MKKIKDMLRRIGTAGLAAIVLTAQMPVTAFAEEIAQPQEIVVSDEAIPAKVQMEDVLPIETYGDTATTETNGFSLYTVEFTYDNKQYVLPGDSEAALSEILDTVGLTGEVSAVEVSDESLFSAKKCKTVENGNTPEKDEEGNSIEDENGTWFVFAHQAFSSEEWMKVTIGGVVYEIVVTDDETADLTITTIDGWKTFARAVASGTDYSGETVTLGADLDFLGTSFTYEYIVGFLKNESGYDNGSKSFKGTFDGNGHTIKNVTITANTNDLRVGCLFYKNEGTIRNTVFDNITITALAQYAGFIAHTNAGTIDGCTISGTMNRAGSGYWMGGVVNTNSGTIQNCYVNVKDPNGNVVKYDGNGTLTNVYCTSDCTGTKQGTVVYKFVAVENGGISSLAPTTGPVCTFGTNKYYTADTEVTFTAEVESGKTDDPIYCNGVPVNKNSNGSYTFTVAEEDVKVQTKESLPDRTITCANASGGTITASPSTAHAYEEITLTATPESGYLLNGITATTSDSKSVSVSYKPWYEQINTASFRMPDADVTVTPVFTAINNTSNEFSINIPKTGTETATIPSGMVSFKVYDHAGASGNYGPNCDGTLTLAAPAGYGFQISGRVDVAGNSYGYQVPVSISDGTNTLYSATKINTTLSPIICNSNTLTIGFVSDNDESHNDHAGLDLTVSLINLSQTHNVTISSTDHGTMTSDVASAKAGTKVTLTAAPATDGNTHYMLEGVSVTYTENGTTKNIAVDGGWWTNNVLTFTMPYSDVVVTPTFVEGNADGGSNINGLTYVGKTDTEQGYYKIDSSTALNALAAYVNGGGRNVDMLFKQTADIDMQGAGFTPIGKNDDNVFSGTYDGDGYVILNLGYSDNNQYSGMFGKIVNGTVKNVNLKDCKFTGVRAGGIAGNMNGGTVTNCSVIGGTVSCGANDYSGGIVGCFDGGAVKDCFAANTVSAYSADTGKNGPIVGKPGGYTTNNYYTVDVLNVTIYGGKQIYGGFITAGDGVTIGSGVWRTIGKTAEHTYYFGKQSDAITFSAEIPTAGMKKFTTTAGTLAGTSTAGTVSLSMPSSDVTVSLADATLTISNIDHQTYTGSAITPEPTVKDGEKTLTKDTDYTLSYSNNTNAAESTATNAPTITITGKGSYSGTGTVKFTIKQKPVTVGGIKAKYKVYDTTTTAELDCSGATFAGKVDGDRLSVTATGAFEDANAGKDKTVTISGLTLGGESKDNYVLAQSGHQTTTTATITRATPEVTAPTARFRDTIKNTYVEMIPYGTPLSNVELNDPTGNMKGTWTWATDNGINPNETAVGTVGTHVFWAKFTPTDTANYCETTKDVTVTVGKATPHLTIESFSAPYGHPVSVKSNCNSDGKVTYVFYKSGSETKTNAEDGAETEGGPPRNAGTYDIVASVAETSNYLSNEQTLANGCVISKAPNPAVLRSTVTVRLGESYDLSGLVSDAKGTVSFALKESKDGYSLSGSTLTLEDNADSSCTITVTADGTVDGKSNYETFSGELTVNATDLLPQDSFGFADVAQEKTYGDGDFTVAATGAETGSNVTYSSSDPAVATVEAETGKVHILKVGEATITAAASETNTYASATASYKLTVNRKPVTIRGITADDLVYNPATAQHMTLNTGGAVIDGKLGQDELTVEEAIGTCDADAGKNKTVTILTMTLGGSSKENYTVDLENSQKTTTINITKAEIPSGDIIAPQLKADLKYTGSAQELITAGSVAGGIGTMQYALGTDTSTAPTTGWRADIPTGTNVGTYYVWYKVKGDTNHNDTVPQSVQVSVAKAPHSNQTAGGSAKYGASGTVDLSALIEEGGTVGTITKTDSSNVLNGDTSVSDGKLNFAFANTAGNAGKTAAVTVPVTSANYLDYNITVTLTVNAKDVPILTVGPITKTYDGATVTGAQIRGTAKVNGTEIKGTWKFEYDANFVDAADSGAKKVIFTPEDTATYDKAEAMLALTINKAVITIKAADKSISVGETVPYLNNPASGKDYTVTGLVGSDRLETAPTLSYSAAPDNTKAGSYTITPGGAAVPASGNYADAISYQTGTLTIKAKSGGGSTGGGNTGGGGSSESGGNTGGGGSSGGGNSGSGGSPSPVTPSENYTVPVSGENTVEVTTEITNGNAVINEISKSDIDRIVDSGSGSKSGDESIPIIIDVSQAKSEVSSVELSGKTMERLTEAVNAENNVESVEIKLTNATVTLDGAALSAVNEQAEGKSVTLAVEDTNTGNLNKAQQSSLERFDSARPFRAAFESDGKEIHDFKGGSVRVSLSFSPEKGRDARYYHIYYLPKAGAIERLLTYYINGLLSFVTSHFSDYAIVYDQSIENGAPEDPVNPEDPVELIEMHRLYNPNSGEHFYTGDAVEKDHLVELGWNYEGVAWNAPEKSEIPVYRLYNPNAGDHHYTTDVKERDHLIEVGWNDEGIGWYSEESESVPLFRLYNPNALMAGAHHYTADAAERDHLIEIGWRDEKTGWYGALRMEAGAA